MIGKVVRSTVEEFKLDGDKVDLDKIEAIAFDPYSHGYNMISGRVGYAFKDGLKLKYFFYY